ncbi:MAG: DUF47 family protein [Chloroflexi bacterium]|nr:DUF47 family protein [Chloroflexota bacterium]
MKFQLAGLISDLRGQTNHRFVDLLGEHLDETRAAAELAGRAVRGDIAPAEANAAMIEVEHRGDDLRRDLARLLSTTLITPIDREDISRISRSIDDVLDNLRDFLLEFQMFAPDDQGVLEPVLEAVIGAIAELRLAISVIVAEPGAIMDRSVRAKKAGNEIRRRYEVQLAAIFSGALSMDVLKLRELLRRLDVVGLRVGEAANALSDAAVKRSEG